MSRRQQDLFPELSDGKKYVSDIPELVAEWHPTKNEGKQPEDFRHASPAKIWWRCSHGHDWQSTIGNRSQGKGCPYCAGLYPTEDYNLKIINPDLCREWHPKNKKSASDYLPKSGKKVWWRCERGHEWYAQIASRTDLEGNTLIGCPFCSGKRASKNYNLSTERPELLTDWCYEKNQVKPTELTPNSHTKVWWKCMKGHTWFASPHNRRNGTGCPNCTHQTSRAEIRILTELMAIYENVISRHKIDGLELDIYVPDLKVGVEYDGAFWHADKLESDVKKQLHFENLGIRLLRVREAPLTKISDTDIIVNPRAELSKKVVNNLINVIGGDVKKKQRYLFAKNFVNQKLFNTYLDYFPSPFPEKSLAALNPELANEWHPTNNSPLTPLNFTENSGHKVWWQCDEGHEWQATIDGRNRKSGGTGCPYCSPTYRLASPENNLALKFPDLLRFFHPTKNGDLTPKDVTHGSEKPIWWRCPNDPNHEFFRSPNHLTSSKASELCPFCSGYFVSDTNSMAATHPNMALIFHPRLNKDSTPENVKAGSREKFWWRCEQGHEWEQTAFNIERTKSENPCPLCKTLAGKRPEIAALMHPTKNGKLTGYDLGCWSTKKVWWQCHSNPEHEWQTSASVMVQPSRKASCQYCPPERISRSISDTHPLMAQAFHPEKNGQLTPQKVLSDKLDDFVVDPYFW
jgi:hypothetical protein